MSSTLAAASSAKLVFLIWHAAFSKWQDAFLSVIKLFLSGYDASSSLDAFSSCQEDFCGYDIRMMPECSSNAGVRCPRCARCKPDAVKDWRHMPQSMPEGTPYVSPPLPECCPKAARSMLEARPNASPMLPEDCPKAAPKAARSMPNASPMLPEGCSKAAQMKLLNRGFRSYLSF